MSGPAQRLLINGALADRVPALDRGFSLGDGLFETISVRRGRPRLWREHGERLAAGCERLGLPPPDWSRVLGELERLRAGDADGTARVTWTRGPGTRGYAPPARVEPTLVIAWFPGLPELPGRPLRLRWCRTRLGENAALAGMKHLNRLEQVLARAEWDDPEIDEGIMCSTAGDVVECTSSNLFLVEDERLITAALDRCGVAGVVRRHVLELADSLAIPCTVGRVDAARVATATEAFVTNASRGLAPVGDIDGRHLAAPGPVTRRLLAGLGECWS